MFTDAGGGFGNLLGVFPNGSAVPEAMRQPIAAELGFSETVFIDDPDQGRLRLFTPAAELPFAGHPLVGTAWLLGRYRRLPYRLSPPAGRVRVREQAGLIWITAPAQWCPTWAHIHAETTDQVDSATDAPAGHDHVQIWAYEDKAAGIVRARTFAPRFGVREDEACGSASMILAALLGQALTLHHGNGSEIFVTPRADGLIDLGGRVCLHETRTYGTEPASDAARADRSAPQGIPIATATDKRFDRARVLKLVAW